MSAPHPRPGPPPLVGRAHETRALRWALDELADGRGAILELTGDPGIGKTRLLLELADEGQRRGFTVLRGNATEFERDLPFQVFVDALADRYRHSEPGGAAQDAARRLSAVFAGRDAPGSGAERFRVYSAVRDLLTSWADRGLLLLLDDMHWADPGAIELADYLIRRPPEAPLLLALAHRGRQSHARLAGTLARGTELGTVTRLEIGPLTDDQSAELAGDALDETTRQTICAESGGNPLYLLAATAAMKGQAPAAAAAWTAASGRAPNRLEAMLLAELSPLTPEQSTIAAAGAVVGDQFSIDVLPAVAGLSGAEVASAIRALTRRDVLRTTESPATLEFRHPVLRRLVYHDCDPAWRAAAHRRALAELARHGASAPELAHHVAASPGDDLPADIALLLKAAHDVMNSAPAAAAQWLRAALRMLPDDTAHAQQRLEILLLLTRALGVAGRLAESRDLLHEILRVVPLRPPGPRVEAVTFCARMERLLARYPEARALLKAELASPRAAATSESVPPGSVWWSRVAAILHAVALLMSGDPARCAQVLTTAGGGAGLPLLQPSMRPTSLDMLTAASVLTGDNGAAREASMRADAESRRLGLTGQRGMAVRSRGFALAAAGRHAEAVTAYREAAELLSTAGFLVGQGWALALGAHSALETRQTGLALAMAEKAQSLARSVGSLTTLGMAEGTRRRLAGAGRGQAGPGQAGRGQAGRGQAGAGDPLAELTSREYEIAQLAATGRSSRDIAEQLSLSPRTVDTHLSRIYRKLGLASRGALAAWWPGPSA